MGLNMSGVSVSKLGTRSSSLLGRLSNSALVHSARGLAREAQSAIASPNPDPFNCEVISIELHATCTIMLVHYPTCTTYEGHKLLLFALA
jgi:hypothetical protein